jgi:tRNA1Val (adenine37-N6)-methyltransferase
MFRFKQFTVDQTGCAMKINTDGVLLGAIAAAEEPKTILDIGTGTGVIALMLAQKYPDAKIDAVEIEVVAAETAARNFAASPFADRVTVYALPFENYFSQFPERKYDLIVSNPPFYIDSLKSPGAKKALAKHADADFFETLIESTNRHLTAHGSCWLILPTGLAEVVISLAEAKHLFVEKMIHIQSYHDSVPHRVILQLALEKKSTEISNFTIYQAEKMYSDEYQHLLKPYFIVF